MNDKYYQIIAGMSEFYDNYYDEILDYGDLASRACDAFNTYVPGTYRIPDWIFYAAKMIIAIAKDERNAS